MDFSNLKTQDTEVYNSIMAELKRQQNKIELIALENFVSPGVMETRTSMHTI